MSNTATTPKREMPDAGVKRGAITLTAASLFDFSMQLLLPVALVRLLLPGAFADYRLAWLAIGAAVAIAPLALPRSLLFFLPRSSARRGAAYLRQTLLALLITGLCAGVLLGPWNVLLPRSVRAIAGAAWFMPAFLAMWVAASLADLLPNARGEVRAQARRIVTLAFLRVAMVALAAISGRIEIVFGALLVYAAIKLAVVLREVWRHAGPDVQSDSAGALREQLAYALPFGLASALFLLRGQADQWVAAALFPATAFAAFSIGAVIMPLAALVRNSVSNAITPRLSALQASRDQAGMLRLNQRANLASALVLVPTLALIAMLAVHIVTVVYTPYYALGADVMRINCLALLGVAVEVSTLTVVLGQGRFLLCADAVLLPVSLAASVIGATIWGLPGAALGNLLTLAAGNAFSFWRVARVTGVPVRALQQWGALSRILAAALLAAGLCVLLDRANLVRAALPEALLLGALFAAFYVIGIKVAGLLPVARALFGRAPSPSASSLNH